MSNQMDATSIDLSEKTAVPMDASTRLSYERTILSHDRTLMSWIRTATSLITFGFTIYKFFQLEHETLPRPRTHQLISAREFAMFMIAIGLFALVLATIQNWQFRKNMRKQRIEASFSLSSLIAGLISALGLLAMASTLFRW
jgi:putative membrane protein